MLLAVPGGTGPQYAIADRREAVTTGGADSLHRQLTSITGSPFISGRGGHPLSRLLSYRKNPMTIRPDRPLSQDRGDRV